MICSPGASCKSCMILTFEGAQSCECSVKKARPDPISGADDTHLTQLLSLLLGSDSIVVVHCGHHVGDLELERSAYTPQQRPDIMESSL